jgi:hypothetical protein
MQHYWGAKAILERIGYSPKSYRRFPLMVLHHRIPCYLKQDPQHKRPMYYTNEALIVAGDLQKAKQHYEETKAKYGAGSEFEKKALAKQQAKDSQAIPGQVA